MVGPIHLFDIATQRNEWLSVRQSTIAGNIANANTPGFKAQDVAPFKEVMDATRLSMASTDSRHIAIVQTETGNEISREEKGWEVSHSGNSVSLEQELIKAGEVNRSFALNTNIMKVFHRMILASTRG